MQGVVPELALDSFRFNRAALQLDLGDGRRRYLAEVLDLVRCPAAWIGVDGDDDGERLTGAAGDARAEKAGDA